jgi:hypothetical protein
MSALALSRILAARRRARKGMTFAEMRRERARNAKDANGKWLHSRFGRITVQLVEHAGSTEDLPDELTKVM